MLNTYNTFFDNCVFYNIWDMGHTIIDYVY